MKVLMTYVTNDGKEFKDQFQAKRHECELTTHQWEYYNAKGSLQKELGLDTTMRFCKYCSKQDKL